MYGEYVIWGCKLSRVDSEEEGRKKEEKREENGVWVGTYPITEVDDTHCELGGGGGKFVCVEIRGGAAHWGTFGGRGWQGYPFCHPAFLRRLRSTFSPPSPKT